MIPVDFSEAFKPSLSPAMQQALAILHRNTGVPVEDLVSMFHGLRGVTILTRQILADSGFDPRSSQAIWGVLHELTDATPEKSQYITIARALVAATNSPDEELALFLAGRSRPRPAPAADASKDGGSPSDE